VLLSPAQVEPRVSSGSQGADDITVETLEPVRKIATMPIIAAGECTLLYTVPATATVFASCLMMAVHAHTNVANVACTPEIVCTPLPSTHTCLHP
jgi:hypothetical protein